MDAQQPGVNSAEGVKASQKETEASAAARSQATQQDRAKLNGETFALDKPMQVASLASDAGKPDQANLNSAESAPLAPIGAELSGVAQPQMAREEHKLKQLTEPAHEPPAAGNTVPTATSEEPPSVTEHESLTHALEGTHLDPEKDLAEVSKASGDSEVKDTTCAANGEAKGNVL